MSRVRHDRPGPRFATTARLRDGALVADLVRQRLRQGGTVRLRGTGFSMFPLVPPGTSVTLGAASPSDLRAGDLVAFQSARGVACHVFDGLDAEGRLRTHGISSGPDRSFDPARLVGRVLSVHAARLSIDTNSRLFQVLLRLSERGGALPGRLASAAWKAIRALRRPGPPDSAAR